VWVSDINWTHSCVQLWRISALRLASVIVMSYNKDSAVIVDFQADPNLFSDVILAAILSNSNFYICALAGVPTLSRLPRHLDSIHSTLATVHLSPM